MGITTLDSLIPQLEKIIEEIRAIRDYEPNRDDTKQKAKQALMKAMELENILVDLRYV